MSETVKSIMQVMKKYVNDDVAQAIVGELCKELGGANLYLPRSLPLPPEVEEEIAHRFNGSRRSVIDICREYDISFNHVYTIAHRVKKRRSKQYRHGPPHN